jgi:hypothetical protein
MLPPSQTPQRAHSTTGHLSASEVPTPRGMSMGRIMVAFQPPDSIRRWSTTTRLPPGWSIFIKCGGRPRGHRPCPCPNARSESLRTSFDGRDRESQSSHALERIEGIMARMERHLVASTSAPATSTAPHPAPFYPGKFHSFHFHFEFLKICLYFTVFTFRGFYPFISLPALVRVRSITFATETARENRVLLHPDSSDPEPYDTESYVTWELLKTCLCFAVFTFREFPLYTLQKGGHVDGRP